MMERLSGSSRPSRLTVVYDGDCLLCRRSAHWIDQRGSVVPIVTLSSSSAKATARFGYLDHYGEDMIVADDDGRVWVGPPDAYLIVMWALPGLRLLSYALSISVLKPLAGRVFQLLTGNRHAIGAFLNGGCDHCQSDHLSEVGQSRI